jgi:hypothetical protein
LEGVEDIIFGYFIYIPFIEGRGIIFVLSKDSWFSSYGNVWGNGEVPSSEDSPGPFCRVLT